MADDQVGAELRVRLARLEDAVGMPDTVLESPAAVMRGGSRPPIGRYWILPMPAIVAGRRL